MIPQRSEVRVLSRIREETSEPEVVPEPEMRDVPQTVLGKRGDAQGRTWMATEGKQPKRKRRRQLGPEAPLGHPRTFVRDLRDKFAAGPETFS